MKIKSIVLLILATYISSTSIIYSENEITDLGNEETIIEKLTSQSPSEISSANIQYCLCKGAEVNNEQENFKEKIKIFNSSLGQFLREEYNSNDYADYISQNATHFVELIKIIDFMNLGEDATTYFYTIFKLFNDKFKETEIIDHTIVIHTLREIGPIVGKYLSPDKKTNHLELIKKQLETMIQFKLTEHLNQVTPPTKESDDLASDLTQIFMNFERTAKDSIENSCKLKGIIVSLFENLLGKAVWSKTFYESNWLSFKTIGDLINKLQQNNAIDDEDELDRIKWSLIHGFGKFINVFSIAFPLEFYDEIEDDIKNKAVPMLEEEEQDDFIKSKKETLLSYLTDAETKALAYEKVGIIS